jgi:hypothetical protein
VTKPLACRFTTSTVFAALLTLLLVLIGTAPVRATLINFEERDDSGKIILDTSSGIVSLDTISPYQDFTWTNFAAYSATPGFPGFNDGIVSDPNAAFTGGDELGVAVVGKITVAPGSQFVFTSAYIGSGWYDNLDVTVEGRWRGVLQFSKTVTVNTIGAQPFDFDVRAIDDLEFFSTVTAATTDPFGCGSSGCSQFTFDDMDLSLVSPSTIAEPSAAVVLLSSLGLFALGAARGRNAR